MLMTVCGVCCCMHARAHTHTQWRQIKAGLCIKAGLSREACEQLAWGVALLSVGICVARIYARACSRWCLLRSARKRTVCRNKARGTGVWLSFFPFLCFRHVLFKSFFCFLPSVVNFHPSPPVARENALSTVAVFQSLQSKQPLFGYLRCQYGREELLVSWIYQVLFCVPQLFYSGLALMHRL